MTPREAEREWLSEPNGSGRSESASLESWGSSNYRGPLVELECDGGYKFGVWLH